MSSATSLAPPKVVYTDLNRGYGSVSSAARLADAEVIHYEIVNLLTTTIGDVDFEPTLGSAVPSRIFDPMDGRTEWALEHDLYMALNQWMGSRIALAQDGVQVLASTEDGRGYDIQITYSLIGLGITVTSDIRFNR